MLNRLRANEFICVWSIWNGLFLALLAVSTILGYTQIVFMSDRSHISVLIAVVFLVGWAYSLNRALWVSRMIKDPTMLRREYDEMLLHEKGAGDAREVIASRLFGKLSTVDYIPLVLVSLGLIGTVIGFMMGLSAVNSEMVGNLQAASQNVATMLKDLAIGFVATLVGVTSGVWIQFQKHLIGIETTRLFERILDRRPNA